MNQIQVLQVKIKRVDEVIKYYENQLDATGVKLDELRAQRNRLQSQLSEARESLPVHRPELDREPDGDLLWA